MESKKSELMETKSRLVVARDKGYGDEGDGECSQRYKFPVLRQISYGNKMCSIVTVVDNTALHFESC